MVPLLRSEELNFLGEMKLTRKQVQKVNLNDCDMIHDFKRLMVHFLLKIGNVIQLLNFTFQPGQATKTIDTRTNISDIVYIPSCRYRLLVH